MKNGGLGFEFGGAKIPQRRMQAMMVIEKFDVLANGLGGIFPRDPSVSVDEFFFER